MAKEPRQTRNRARDMIGDYYLANRQVEEENRIRQQAGENNGTPVDHQDTSEQGHPESGAKRKPWTKSEKTLFVVIVLGLIAVVVKYFVLR